MLKRIQHDVVYKGRYEFISGTDSKRLVKTHFIEFVSAQYLNPKIAFCKVLSFIGSFLYSDGKIKLFSLTSALKNVFFIL